MLDENKMEIEILELNSDDKIKTKFDYSNVSSNYNSTWIEILQTLEQMVEESEMDENVRNIIIIICYSLIVVISLLGNLLVCKVIFEKKEKKNTTNYLIANLAVSDLLMTVLNIPFNIARIVLDNWPFGATLCVLVPFVQSVSAHCSSITMMVIAIERVRSLIYSTRISDNIFNKYLGIKSIILIIWIFAAILSIPHGIFNKLVEVQTWRTLIRCRVNYPEPSQQYRRRLTLITFLSQYLIPISLTCICYVRIGFFLWRKEIIGSLSEIRRLSMLKRKRKRIKMLVMVVSVFAICWLPLNVYHILTDYGLINYKSSLFFIVHWFAMSSVCYNPFIYCWLNENFKRRTRMLVKCGSAQRQTEEQNNSVRNDTLFDIIRLQPNQYGSNHLSDNCMSDSANSNGIITTQI